MDLSALARKQKRAKVLSELAQSIGDRALRGKTEQVLSQYKELLVKIWESGASSESDDRALSDLERRLTQLDEEARLSGSGQGPLPIR